MRSGMLDCAAEATEASTQRLNGRNDASCYGQTVEVISCLRITAPAAVPPQPGLLCLRRGLQFAGGV